MGIDSKRYGWKELRHSTASQMHLKGVEVTAIKDQLRHSSRWTTENFYIGSDVSYQTEQIEKLSNERFRGFLTGPEANSEAPRPCLPTGRHRTGLPGNVDMIIGSALTPLRESVAALPASR